ncbi:MAG TPA: RNA polymerase subunit sigma-70 [Polyangiaceae bacterium]|nr:RNA polymerase subunit sigma-70 [Polyangiaceae bacterium]
MPSDDPAFAQQIEPFRKELRAYCYRLLGSVADAEDALQDTLLGAFRGFAGFEGRSSLRSWLYRIATHACLAILAQRPKRLLASDYSPAAELGAPPEAPLLEPFWLEPYPVDAEATFEQRESLELAFIAALQYLPANQRAALILRDVLGFEASEAALVLDTSVASVNSALQRARGTIEKRSPAPSQQATLRALGEPATRELAARFIEAWGRSDADAIVALLAADARFTMPPIPTWFDGREAIRRFLAEHVFATRWRLVRAQGTPQLAFVCYQGPEFGVGALCLLTLEGPIIKEMTGFLDPAVHARFSLPER